MIRFRFPLRIQRQIAVVFEYGQRAVSQFVLCSGPVLAVVPAGKIIAVEIGGGQRNFVARRIISVRNRLLAIAYVVAHGIRFHRRFRPCRSLARRIVRTHAQNIVSARRQRNFRESVARFEYFAVVHLHFVFLRAYNAVPGQRSVRIFGVQLRRGRQRENLAEQGIARSRLVFRADGNRVRLVRGKIARGKRIRVRIRINRSVADFNDIPLRALHGVPGQRVIVQYRLRRRGKRALRPGSGCGNGIVESSAHGNQFECIFALRIAFQIERGFRAHVNRFAVVDRQQIIIRVLYRAPR